MKLPFWKHYPLDWLRDTGVLSNAVIGIWSHIEAYAWNEPERGVYKRLITDFCRQLRIEPEAFLPVISELKKVAEVTASDVEVTIKSRWMVEQERSYKLHANRQFRYKQRRKNDARVTPKTLDVRRQTTSERLTSTSTPARAREAAARLPLGGARALPALAPTEPITPELQGVYLPWEMPESERMTPGEMDAIRLKNLGQRPKQ